MNRLAEFYCSFRRQARRAAWMASHCPQQIPYLEYYRKNLTTGLGRVKFITATANLLMLAPVHKYFLYTHGRCGHNAATKQLVQKVMIIFVNTFMVKANILLYAEILNGLIFDSVYSS